MTPTTKDKHEKKDIDPAKEVKPRSKREAREDAEASRQDRPTTTLPGQQERWENEGGQPGGVISSTDARKPKKDED